jgi:hypothetical protein
MNADQPVAPATPSVLGQLRILIPNQPVGFADTLRLAERQAERLLQLHHIATAPVPSDIVTGLPHIRVVHHRSPISGISHWNGRDWIITLNDRDPYALRRVTLLHEYAHIVWHGHEHRLFAADPYLAYLQSEQAADYFAWNVLIPTRLITEAWSRGIKHIGELAELFEVREYTILARLLQLRLWLPAHHRRQPHWSQLLAPVTPDVHLLHLMAEPTDRYDPEVST